MSQVDFQEGAKLGYENAKRLFDSALVLAERKEYPIANSLMILAAEEASKAFVVKLQGNKPQELGKDFKSIFKDHKVKLQQIRMQVFFSTMLRKMFEFEFEPLMKEATYENFQEKAEYYKKKGLEDLGNWLEGKDGIDVEMQWWKHATDEKENGLYLGFNGKKWQSPQHITRNRFNKTKGFVQPYLEKIKEVIETDFQGADFLSFKHDIQQKLLNNPL